MINISENDFNILNSGVLLYKKKIEQLKLELGEKNYFIIKNLDNKDFNTCSHLYKTVHDLTLEIDTLTKWINNVEYIQSLIDLSQTDSSVDEQFIIDINFEITELLEYYNNKLLLDSLNTPEDTLDAIFTIKAGAGGVEAEDWAGMLFRMYIKWLDKQKFDCTILETLHSTEASNGIKKITFTINGKYAYGKLKFENGIHRLIRNSPFSKDKKRHTSFASIKVTPLIDDSIVIVLDKKDIRIETIRGTGAGGQNKNKLETAVRITHIPTGITAFSQSERTQLINKENAMRVLESRLYNYEKQLQDKEKKQYEDNLDDNSFGSQIRSYVLNPTQYIKDHRSNHIEYDTEKILNGNIDNFLKQLLFLKN